MFSKIKNLGTGNTAVKHGGGVSLYSYKILWRSGTKTPPAKIKTFAPGSRDIPLSPRAPGIGNAFAPVKNKYWEKAAAVSLPLSDLQRSPVDAKNNPVDLMARDRRLYENLLSDKAYFPGISGEKDKAPIRAALQAIDQKIRAHRKETIKNESGEKQRLLAAQKIKELETSCQVSELADYVVEERVCADRSPLLEGAELTMLTAAVAAAARPVNATAQTIANALNILKDLDLEGAIKNMDKESGTRAERLRSVTSRPATRGGYSEEEENLAWRIAYKLASSDSAEGFKLLKSLQSVSKTSPPIPSQPLREPAHLKGAPRRRERCKPADC